MPTQKYTQQFDEAIVNGPTNSATHAKETEQFNEAVVAGPTGAATHAKVTEQFNETIVKGPTGATTHAKFSQFFHEVIVLMPLVQPTWPGSPNVLVRHIAYGQNTKEVTCNNAIDQLDQQFCNKVTLNFNAGQYSLTMTTYPEGGNALRNLYVIVTGTPGGGGAGVVNLPQYPKAYLVFNSTSVNITFQSGGGNYVGVTVAAGKRQELYFDGTQIVALTNPF